MRKIGAFLIMVFVFVSFLGLLSPSPSDASLTFVTNRSELGANDFVNWGGLGPDETVVASGSTITSNLGLSAMVTNPSGDMAVHIQGSSWGGNFAPGDNLLTTAIYSLTGPDYFNEGPIVIIFSSPVSGVGAQIQQNQFNDFYGYIEAFDSANNSLISGSALGYSSRGDPPAIFLGVLDSAPEIKSVKFWVTGDPILGFGINQLDILNPVPLPPTVLLLGSGLLGLVGWRRLKKG
jgi:hypothetical protein